MSATLLLVEDDESDVVFLKRALRAKCPSCLIEVADNGRRAIDVLSGAAKPTHVLLDLKLPEKSGFEVLEWIRGEPALRRVHVAILTSSSQEADVCRAQELRAEGYFVKPMSLTGLDDLARVVDEWTRRDEPPAEMLRFGHPAGGRC